MREQKLIIRLNSERIMEYTGKLYGKIGNKYFDTGRTSEEFDKHQKMAIELQLLKDAQAKANGDDTGTDKCHIQNVTPRFSDKFKPPFRVGRKRSRAILDSCGHEVIVFPIGLEDMAIKYCHFLNGV